MRTETFQSRREFLRTLALGAAAALVAPRRLRAAEAAVRRLNIVLILADDLGWADVACYGADLHETPNIDQLAREGVRFTDAYSSSSVCTPTRAALLTGKHPARLGMTIWSEAALSPPRNRKLLPPPSSPDLPHTETTLAKRLQSAGYLTAIVGKWHLGDATHYPETHGFDVNIGGTLWGAPQTFFYPYRGSGKFGNEYRYVPHLEFGRPGEYLTDRLTDEALQVMTRAGPQPFFLYLAHHAPHTPIEAKPADVEHFTQKLRPGLRHQNPTYAAMVKSLDDSVGRVMRYLHENGLADNTVLVFASDNGGYIGRDKARQPQTTNEPLRSGKGALYEGGIRVPLIVRWPGVTPAGAACREPVVLTDLFLTLLAAAGLSAEKDAAPDGLSLAPLLKQPDARLPREALFFHYPHYYETTTPASAVRAGDWKFLRFYYDGQNSAHRLELYNLKDDLGEKEDLAGRMPDRVKQMDVLLDRFLKDTGAALPKLNPDAGSPPGKGK
jgi:arylsulfatase A-like enzyme